jgi:LAO/AO transport system kinase
LVLMLAGAGDELQGIKKGVLEVADAHCRQQGGRDNVEKAERARKAI